MSNAYITHKSNFVYCDNTEYNLISNKKARI